MSVPTRESVREQLALDESYDEWLAELDRFGAPDIQLVPSSAEDLARLLDRLGFAPQDAAEALATRIVPAEQPELWWLLERSHRSVIRGLGPGAPRWSLPMLPVELGSAGRFFPLHVLLCAVDPLHRWHAQRGIAKHVSWATLRDLARGVAIHRATHGSGGLDKAGWLSLHFHGELYELGRLQFELQTLGECFRPGEAVLGLHIPASGPLTPQACDASLAQAQAFVARHFPDPARRLAVCTSWLLDEQLADYLPADSNIVRFQRRFTLVPASVRDDHEPLRFIFRRVPADLGELPRGTTLQRVLLDHLRDGGGWRIRTGWFPLETA